MRYRDLLESTKDNWLAGETAHYEYHCNQSHDSEDAPLWYRSHQTCVILRKDEDTDPGEPEAYYVRFPDGFEGAAFDDELFTSPDDFSAEYAPPLDSPLLEAPIGDFQFIDKSDEMFPGNMKQPPIRTGSSFRDDDKKALQNPKWREKLLHQFRNVPETINLYAVNAKFLYTYIKSQERIVIANHLSEMDEWAGNYSSEDFFHTFGFLPEGCEDAINFVMVQNEGDERLPLTPWMVGHRMIHALLFDRQNPKRDRADYQLSFSHAWSALRWMMRKIEDGWEATHDRKFKTSREYTEDNKNMWAAATGLKSARDRRIERSGEVLIELFTQYLFTGDFKISTEWMGWDDPENEEKLESEIRKWEQAAKERFGAAMGDAIGHLIVF